MSNSLFALILAQSAIAIQPAPVVGQELSDGQTAEPIAVSASARVRVLHARRFDFSRPNTIRDENPAAVQVARDANGITWFEFT